MRRHPTVTEALFGDLPDEVRRRYGLTGEGEAPHPHGASPAARPGGKGPASPFQLSWDSWIAVVKRTVSQISSDRVMSVAGGVTFFGLLALFPAITAFVSIFGLVADRSTVLSIDALLQQFLPGEAAGLITNQIEAVVNAPGASLSFATLIGLGGALYSAMGGSKALMEALNVAWFETEKRGFLHLNLIALAFTLGAIVIGALLIVAIAVVPALLHALNLGGAVAWLRWPVLFGVLLLALAALYRWGPSFEKARWHWISPGALFAAVGLVVASLLFSWYAQNFGNYNKTYGSLGAVIVLMMWVWIAAMVVLVGAELNSEADRQVAIENGRAPKGPHPRQSR